MSEGARRVAWWGAAVFFVLLGLGLRASIDGRSELARAQAALEAADADLAVLHYGRAARWRVPLARHDEAALEGLRKLALAHEGDDATLSLIAYRELRRALLSTRTPAGVSDPELLAHANEKITALMAQDGDASREARLGAQLAAPRHAPTWGTWTAALLFVCWLGCVYGFFSRAVDEQARLVPRAARVWGFAVILSLIAWMLLTRHPEWIAAAA